MLNLLRKTIDLMGASPNFNLQELLKPLIGVFLWFQEIISWERPAQPLAVLAATLITIYKYVTYHLNFYVASLLDEIFKFLTF